MNMVISWSKNIDFSLGTDGIHFETIKNISIKYHILLLDIYNEMLNTRFCPNLGVIFVHFIDKPDGKLHETIIPIGFNGSIQYDLLSKGQAEVLEKVNHVQTTQLT